MGFEMSGEDLKKVGKIRLEFDKEYAANPELYEREDRIRVLENDYYVWRFLDDKDGDEDDAIKMLVKSLRWRKKNDVKSIRETDFPREIYHVVPSHFYVNDKNGFLTYYNRLKVPPAPKEFLPLMTRMVIMAIESIDQLVLKNKAKVGLIVDCSDASITQLEMSSNRDLMGSVQAYYPNYIEYLAYYEMSSVLKAIYKMVKTFAPPKMTKNVIFLTKDNIDEMIGLQNVPEYMGGSCSKPYIKIMDHCPSVEEVATLNGISIEAVKEFHKLYDPFLEEFQRKREEIENLGEAGSTFL